MSVTKLDQVIDLVKSRPLKRIVVAYGQDPHTIGAVADAVKLGFVKATLVGDQDRIHQLCQEQNIDPTSFEIIHEPVEIKAGQKAVDQINQGNADLIMKGLMSTDNYMRVILHKERGMMNPGAVLTHVTVFDVPTYHKLMIAGDVAVIPLPDLAQKITIAKYLISTAHRLNIEMPKLAVLAATEKVSYKMPACADAAIIAMMGQRNQLPGAIIDGPLALDLAIDPESVAIKGMDSPVAGDADCLLFPNIETGNVFYKSLTKFAHGELAAVVMGARTPAILTSRGDSEKTKLYSIALGALLA